MTTDTSRQKRRPVGFGSFDQSKELVADTKWLTEKLEPLNGKVGIIRGSIILSEK